MISSRNLGVHPQNIPTAQQRQRKSPISLFFLFFYLFGFQCDLCLFNFCRIMRRVHSLALTPKKSVALQAERVPSPDIAPVSGKSGANVAVLLAGQAPSAVAPMPLVGQAGARAEEAPSGGVEQTTTEVTPLPTLEWTEQPPVLVAPSVVGAASQVEAPMSQAEEAFTSPL